MDIDADTISTMASAGIRFIAYVRAPGGSETIQLSPNEIPAFVSDPEQFTARNFGVSKSQYLDWVQTDGTPRCGAKTKKGTRCRNLVSGGIQRSISEWLRLDGGYCTVHGGEGSEEARAER